ncbi:hypothetical protein OSB04_017883 [Centaurea solstitialis]|uniref:DUF7795 domain-containing protein n=1 Tax=Centaurea solstitialis TaxID=347529 RepID=A0AA38TNP7_9ASTR|nr:hypothetical protein OSB04_017883 [Centaurea solstitialis]
METEEASLNNEFEVKVFQIFSQFMERVAKFEEVAASGNRYLVSFRQALEFIRRPSIEKTSLLFQKVIKANETDRIQSYVKAGYVHTTDNEENIKKSKIIMNELECLAEDINLAIEAAVESLQEGIPDLATTYTEEGIVSSVPEKPRLVDYASMVALVFYMVKRDYEMQEKIVSSLGLKTSSGELESYCLMWSLRPFVEDEVMHQAWRLIP